MAPGRQGSGSARYAAMTVALLAIVQCAMATNYTVGGSSGWNLQVDYKKWAAQYTFKGGDTLLFRYSPESHTVLQVTQGNYKTCTLANPLKSYQSGSDSFTLSSGTTYYFICGIPGHCAAGMALTIDVSGGSTPPAPSPAPTLSPAPKSSPVPAPVHSPPTQSPSPSLSKPNPSPSPSESVPSPSPSGSSTSPPSSPSSLSPPSLSPPPLSPPPSSSLSPPSPSNQPPSPPNAASTVHSGIAVLLSAVLLSGFSLFF